MSSHLDVGAAYCRKRRRGGERVFKFRSFGENGCPVEFDGSFRDNVNALLEYGHLESNLCNGMLSWSFQLEVHRHPPLHTLLFVVEEPIEASISLYCKHCQYVGWGHHMICNKKYHFLLPSKDAVAACFSCGESNLDDPNPEKGKFNLVELQGHIMHGVFHSNGFGHLLCVNGVEMGSDLAGYQIMDFWDRLCTGLQARKVSLNDTSRKRGMELRLLHGVAYGEPWFGRWGYKFGRGCYGVNEPIYQKAIEAIQGMPLCLLNHHLSISYNDISVIFSRYQALADHSMVTLGDLFDFMLGLRSRLPKENSIDSCNPAILVETSCRWSHKRVEAATRVIVEALKRAEFRWVSRQEVRDAARAYIGDTGLLDFVLKSLGNHIVGNYLVRRCLNPVTKVLEYCLEDISTVFPNPETLLLNNSKVKPRCKITKAQLMKDISFLFKHILKEQKPTLSTGIFPSIPMAARIILDTKFLAKEYSEELSMKVKSSLNGKFKLFCTVILRNDEEIDEGLKKPMLPCECVTLQETATINDLKLEVEKNFRQVYWRLRSFVVETVVNLNAKGSDLVLGSVEMGQTIVVVGSNDDQTGMIMNEVMMCEWGLNSRIVECPCGAREDDGERLISCDICEVWQHTRCVRIPNNEEIPHVFLCKQCEEKIMFLPSLP
ncbi:PREDICTED: PHD finger protein MALE STERILITY 1 [Theobroma cacao]|uniref:PHD finger protein MALE STERILITY 1 n=1 Tax=Theobroma cacao TaxID=3641 RepID=A0AB32VFN3_THECC|nr:PREDICTED: PHD finger protein MALE STERILITY 1 [Theobroma cacao]